MGTIATRRENIVNLSNTDLFISYMPRGIMVVVRAETHTWDLPIGIWLWRSHRSGLDCCSA